MIQNGTSPLRQAFLGLATFCLIVLILIIGKPILAPLMLAGIIAFVLLPVVSVIERQGINRVLAVSTAMFIVVSLAAVLGIGLVSQIRSLAADLPQHTQEIRAKYDGLRELGGPLWEKPAELLNRFWATNADGGHAAGDTGPADRTAQEAAGDQLPDLDRNQQQLGNNRPEAGNRAADQASEEAAAEPEPTPVVVQSADENPVLRWAPTVFNSVAEPIASGGLVVVLATFMLLRREDLRNRLLALLGRTRLAHSTHLLEDASERLSGYLLGLVSVNFGFSIAFTLGLMLLGVPYAALWGAISFFARFIPIIGSAVSMLAPLAMAIATVPGWLAPLGVIALYLMLEGITGNLIEPWLYGRSVGMNPVAILVAFMFWTWAWGFIGLALSTPLTLILVTLSMHVPSLSWINVLLGDSHPLPKPIAFYQRLLAQDRCEADRFLRGMVEKRGPSEAMQTLLLPAWRRADRELNSGAIDQTQYDALAEEANLAVESLIAQVVAGQTSKNLADDRDTERDYGRTADRAADHAASDGRSPAGLPRAAGDSEITASDVAGGETTDGDVAAGDRQADREACQESGQYATLRVATYAFQSDRADHVLRLLLSGQDRLDVVQVEKWTPPLIRRLMKQPPDMVLLSVIRPTERDQAIAIAKTLRRHGYRGWLALGWWRNKPLRRSTRLQLKDAGFDYVTYRLRSMERMLRYSVENNTNDFDQPPAASTVQPPDHADSPSSPQPTTAEPSTVVS